VGDGLGLHHWLPEEPGDEGHVHLAERGVGLGEGVVGTVVTMEDWPLFPLVPLGQVALAGEVGGRFPEALLQGGIGQALGQGGRAPGRRP
jgi:hypothetical protein